MVSDDEVSRLRTLGDIDGCPLNDNLGLPNALEEVERASQGQRRARGGQDDGCLHIVVEG
jgi:hypothetical protein